MTRTFSNGDLSKLDKEIIESILAGKIEGTKKHEMSYPTVAYAVWLNDQHELHMGPVRWGYRRNYITNEGIRHDSLSISPFPGAWVTVPIYQIVNIRHIEAI